MQSVGTSITPRLHPATNNSDGLRRHTAGLVASDEDVETFHILGATFASPSGGPAEARTKANGAWTDWTPLEPSRDDANAATPGALVPSEPRWVANATGYAIRFPADATNVAVHLVRDAPINGQAALTPLAAAADTPATDAGVETDPDVLGTTATPLPFGIRSRASWGARAFKIHPGMGNPLTGVQMAIVHHTAQANDYTQAEVPTIVRGLQAYDMDIRHYDDLGYNVVVDKFGGIWEGRGGGLDQAVVGAHALGMNQVSTGIVVMGNFVDMEPPAEVLDAIAKVAGWKLSLDGYDPTTKVTLVPGEDEGHPAHPFPLTTPRIIGHQDVGQTECPGRLWDRLPEIRTKALAYARKGIGRLDTVRQSAPKTITVEGTSDPADPTPADVVIRLDHRAVTTLQPRRTKAAAPSPTFQTTLTATPGPHRVCAYDTTTATGALLGCRSITVIDPNVNPIRPVRVFDSRNAPSLRLRAGVVRAVDIAGEKTVPNEAAAVAANVTVTGPTKAGYLTVTPCGSGATNRTSNVNFVAGQTIPVLVLTKVGTGGQVCLFSDTDTDVIIDVSAWFPSGGAFTGLAPVRLLDTRTPANPLKPNTTRRVQVAGVAGVPKDATAAALSIVATRPKAAGWLAVFPCDSGFTGTSNLNFAYDQTIANLAVTKLAADGSVCLRGDQTVDAIVDVTGSFSGSSFHPVTPTRILDTRSKLGTGRISFEDTIELKMWGQPNIPSNATSVFANLTITNPAKPNYLTVYPCAQVHPGTSNLNFAAGQTVPNLTLTKIGLNGCIRLDSGADTDAIADVMGYFT